MSKFRNWKVTNEKRQLPNGVTVRRVVAARDLPNGVTKGTVGDYTFGKDTILVNVKL